ncbi:MAG: twin-arginine translocase subunit TatB [Proteobacteria bacterium]|jgi:sec-independent protein translocase protein TatB|nr:Sec-independent protein translocase protein TatB [Alphaproteobacteria bacterium]NCC03906.1 twin-arginine translocase subunit TatB [Pseudomonadota bacterium]
MFEIGWTELVLVGVIALVIVGPKDLPKVMHTLGRWVAKGRRAFLAFEHQMNVLDAEAQQLERKEKDKRDGTKLTTNEPHDN